jgi:hypothetical protein
VQIQGRRTAAHRPDSRATVAGMGERSLTPVAA